MDFLSQHKSEKCLVIGDFNFTPDASNVFTKQMKDWNFSQLVDSATHKDGNIIDHAYTSEILSTLTFVDLHYVYYSAQCPTSILNEGKIRPLQFSFSMIKI